MARLLIRDHGENRRILIKHAYLRVLGRFPNTREIELGLEFLIEAENLHDRNATGKLLFSLQDLCHVLINLNEFVFMQ